jgi:hypothetical protein
VRWAEPGGDEYVLHQDVYGELALCLYLDDHPTARARWRSGPVRTAGRARSRRFRTSIRAGSSPTSDTWTASRATCACSSTRPGTGARARAVERGLVFLISFLPPGPIEKPRRVPEDLRAHGSARSSAA